MYPSKEETASLYDHDSEVSFERNRRPWGKKKVQSGVALCKDDPVCKQSLHFYQ